MANPAVKDKDGISAAVVLAHLIRDVYGRGSTLAATLDDLYKQYVTRLSGRGLTHARALIHGSAVPRSGCGRAGLATT